MKDSIAIIGVSFDLPNIKNWNDLRNSLSDHTSFIGEMPENRSEEIQKVFGKVQMARAGYLKEIDKFDNEYFGFTERESLRTFPEHRLFLSHAMRAFYHAGYNEASLKGSKTGIFFTGSKTAYLKFSNVADLSFGHADVVHGIEGTRLAKYLDTRGPVISINTSCSSSLVAINVARQSLNDNECEIAIVGGVKILTLTNSSTLNSVVHSKKGECKPFDEDADGMINGEGAIFFVLKRYEQAVKDGDAILAEIRGIGINHGGDRISSLTAPSSDAQKDVIIQAWKKAGVDPGKVRYIEAHGTATILGDPIEIEGIKQAFQEVNATREDSPCGLSSFKGQIGHLDYLAGLAGLLRLVAALNYKVIPAQSNFKTLNKYFNIEHTGIYVPAQIEDWPDENGERIGGVSSFGMTGTNVHLVVSQNDAHVTDVYHENEVNYLQVSHKDHQKLAHYKSYIRERIAALDSMEDIHKLCLKLNSVFQIDKENQGIIYSSRASLIAALESKNKATTERQFLLLDLDVVDYSKDFITSLFIENVYIRQAWDKYVSLSPDNIQNQQAVNILFQYTIYRYLLDKTANSLKFITPKGGSILNALIKSEITVSQVINETHHYEQLHHDFDEQLFIKYLKDNFAGKEITIIDFSGKDKNRFNDLNLKLDMIAGSFPDSNRFLLYSNILETGVNPLKTGFRPVFNDIDLPYYNLKRFWPDVKVKPAINKPGREEVVATPEKNKVSRQLSKEEIEKIVRNSWTLILETNDFKDEDDFFELGGTSLAALDMIDEIAKNIEGVKIPYEEIYSCATIAQLSDKILSQLGTAGTVDNEVIGNQDSQLREARYKELIRNIKDEHFSKHIPGNILVTGGTGLLGMNLIDYLINHTTAQLYCLVRKQGYDSAAQRFWSVYEKYFDIEDKSRITVIEGDLYLEGLGIKKPDALAHKIDMIFHVAGSPQFVSEKGVDEHINYLGTKNIVNWANQQEIRYLSFVSTIGVVGKVMPAGIENFYETDTNLGQQNGNLIHGASKLKAEEYINGHYKYESKIFRIPNLGGRLRDGNFPTNLEKNLMWLRLKSLSELEFYCEELLNEKSGIGFIPVDVVSALISEISFTKIDALNVYHIERRQYFSNGEVLSSFKKAGIPITPTSYDNFITYIDQNNHKMNYHQVAQKNNKFSYRADATNEIISRLNLAEMLNFDTQLYLDRIIGTNLKAVH